MQMSSTEEVKETKEAKKKYAFITVVFGKKEGDRYAASACAGAKALRDKETIADLVCMVTHDISDEAKTALRRNFDKVVQVDYITSQTTRLSKKQESIYGSWKDNSFTKWQCLGFTEYEKVVFFDTDIIVLENIDDLFAIEAPAACFSTPWAKPFAHPGLANYYLKDGNEPEHGGVIQKEDIALGLENSFVINGGMVVLAPNMEHLNLLRKMFSDDKCYGHKGCVSMHDEQAITELYYNLNIKWHHISQTYNFFVGKTSWLSLLKQPEKVWHYYGIKPWLWGKESWPDLKLWWTYIDMALTKEEKETLLPKEEEIKKTTK